MFLLTYLRTKIQVIATIISVPSNKIECSIKTHKTEMRFNRVKI